MVKLLDNDALQQMVDYSFGDHSGVLGGVPQAFMKKANISNTEFTEKVRELYEKQDVMTLFIDNIRLYRRPIEYSDWLHMKPVSTWDRAWLNRFEDEDLLSMLWDLKTNMKFIIFTAFEDTPLDDHIWDKIPDKVISINPANGVVFGGKIKPFPHGIERKMYRGYDHHEILERFIEDTTEPHKTLLVCHRDDTGARGSIKDMFKDKPWATVSPKLDYEPYLQAIKDHKFVLCPSGNGIESARNWETLYMRRVPVFKRHPYLEEMFKDFPAVFVDDFSEVTQELLESNAHLYQQAQEMSMDGLDLEKVFNSRLQ